MPSLDQIYQNHCFQAPLNVPPRRRPSGSGAYGPKHIKISLVPALASVHPLLPPTTFWSFDGCVPGPTWVVDADGPQVRVVFDNQLVDAGGAPLPMAFKSVTGVADQAMNEPGSAGAAVNGRVTGLPAWVSTHLHGAPTAPDSDGWPENTTAPGTRAEHVYEFPAERYAVHDNSGALLSQFDGGRAPAFWYHDHAMGATRLNVYAGLAGMCLVRDAAEPALGLPTNQDELVLVIQDRNFETDTGAPGGALTGELLHKNTDGVMEAFAPATLVNGTLWPLHAVRKRLGRLRVLNGCNARVYRLHFMGRRSGQPDAQPLPPEFVQQIGTDGGLLGAAIDLALVPDAAGNPLAGSHSLTLASGERADLLVDFGGLAAAGWEAVEVYNSAPAPYNSSSESLAALADITTPDLAGFRPYPAVMRLEFHPGTAKPRAIRGMPLLGTAFKRLGHADLPHDHGHHLVAMREENGVLFMHELMPEAEANAMGMNMHEMWANNGVDPPVRMGLRLTLPQEPQHAGPPIDVTYVTVAKGFADTNTIVIAQDSWQVWRVLNLSPDTHPFHLHLVQFQGLQRLRYSAAAAQPSDASELVFTIKSAPDQLAPGEQGWKDTMRAHPGERAGPNDDIVSAELLTVAAQFTRHCGHYVYHCHILEHEDHDMMRHFVVMPQALMDAMGHGGMAMP